MIKKITELFVKNSKNYEFIGEDEIFNKYYQNKKNGKRICLYYKIPDPSKIEIKWFSWMHYFN